MVKAIKKGEEFNVAKTRKETCEDDLLAVLEKHGYRLGVSLAYTPEAIIPRLTLIDTQEKLNEENAEPKTEKEAPKD